MSSSDTRQNHPLIPRAQTYVLDRKIISFHSCDRDYKKWPHANHFEINLPESLLNVQSMRLVTVSLPSNQYVFSNEYQNTKLSFIISVGPLDPQHPPLLGSPCPDLPLGIDKTCRPQEFTITIHEGSYTPDELAIEISTQMNNEIVCMMNAESKPVAHSFVCKYNKVSNTFWFGFGHHSVSKPSEFTLLFGKKETYKDLCPGQVCVWDHHTRWGLPAYLGYQKHSYKSTAAPYRAGDAGDGYCCFGFSYENENWLETDHTAGWTPQFVNVYDLSGGPLKICNLDILGEDVIYMEVDRYNTMDEIEPYSENTAGWFNNDYNGKVNSAFAKIPVPCTPYAQVYDSRNGFLTNISHYQPPIERINRLRFKFRYHDGRLVDFKCLPLSFSIEFNMLKDEQLRAAIVRVPPLYRL